MYRVLRSEYVNNADGTISIMENTVEIIARCTTWKEAHYAALCCDQPPYIAWVEVFNNGNWELDKS